MHVGRATRQAISADPYHLVVQMRSQRQWSYLSFLPARYAHDPCLREAADCCVARAQQIVTPQINGEAKVLARHGRALASLQKAISDPKQCYKPEVLCATEILAMYEVGDSLSPAWSCSTHHDIVAGSQWRGRLGPSRVGRRSHDIHAWTESMGDGL